MEAGNQNKSLGKFKIKDRLMSFRNAFSGFVQLVRYEHNARIHFVILVLVISAGLLLGISSSDWIAVTLASGLVIISESFNTAIEYLSDEVSKGYSEKIRAAKDVAAAGVLISAIISVIIGLIVFLPQIYRLL